MDIPPPTASRHSEPTAEHQLVRNVTALTYMPRRWAGRSPAAIAPSLRDSLTAMLRADATLVEVRHPETGAAIVSASGATPDEIEDAIRRAGGGRPALCASASGPTIRLIVYAVGLDGDLGRLIVGSSRDDFPRSVDWLLLQAAGNLLATAVRYSVSRLRYERAEHRVARLAAAKRVADVSARKKAEMLAVISHEMRTPLTAIQGYIDLLSLETHGTLTGAQRESVSRLRSSGEYLTHLVTSVLDYSRLSSGHATYDITSVLVDEALDVAIDVLRPQLQLKHLWFEHFRNAGLCVAADREKLQQIFVNLLSNAVKYTAPGGSIRVVARTDQEMVRVSIIDNGRGIPPDRADSVFEPFIRIAADGSQGPGTGLGLAIAREYAVAMRGWISLESEIGRGSTFTVALPESDVRKIGRVGGQLSGSDYRHASSRFDHDTTQHG